LYNNVKRIDEIENKTESNQEKTKQDINIHEEDADKHNLKMILFNDDPNATQMMLKEYEEYFNDRNSNEDLIRNIINLDRKSSEENENLFDEFFYDPYREYNYESYYEKDNEQNENPNLDEGFYDLESKYEYEKEEREFFMNPKDLNKVHLHVSEIKSNEDVSYESFFAMPDGDAQETKEIDINDFFM